MLTAETIGHQRERSPGIVTAFCEGVALSEQRDATISQVQGVFIGPYSVDDYRFVQAAAQEMAQRLERAGEPLPSDLQDRLGLNSKETAYEIFLALMSILNLTRRRLALCEVIHVIHRYS